MRIINPLLRTIGLMIPLALFALAVAMGPPIIDRAHAQQVGGLYCSQKIDYDASTNGSTRLVDWTTVTSTRQGYICGYTINVGATATNVQLRTGTGTNCGTNTANLTPLWVLPIAGQVMEVSPVWRGITVPAGRDLCIFTSAGNAVQATVYYSYQQ